MAERRSLVGACQALGLDCRCEHLHAELRFRVAFDQSASRPLLYLAFRNDDDIAPGIVDIDDGLPGILFEIAEKTVCRAPGLGAWLPRTVRHRYVAWCEGDTWRLGRIARDDEPATVAEAVAMVRDPAGWGAISP